MSETSYSDDEVTALDGQLYDVIVVHSEKEKELANTVCKKIRQLNLGDDVFPVIDTFENMSLLGNQEVDDVDYAVEQSTFIMFFRTKEFFKDKMRSFATGVALDNAIRSRNKSRRWSLIPIDIETKVKISRKASINSLSGFTITTNGDFDKDMERVRTTLSSKMHVRLEKEKRKAEYNDRTFDKAVGESQACQHPSVDHGRVNPVNARVTCSHHNDMADLVSNMNNMKLDLTSVKRPASESPTSHLYPGPICEETGDQVLGDVQPDRASITETGPNYLEVANPSMGPENSTIEQLPRTAEIPRSDRFPHDDSQGDASMRASSNGTAMSTYSASNVSNDTGLQPQYSAVADVDRSCAGIAFVGLGRQAGGNLNTVILHSIQHRSQDTLHITNTPETLPSRQSSLSEFSLLAVDTGASLNSSDGLRCPQKGPNDVSGFVQSQETQNVVHSVGVSLCTAAVSSDVLPREHHHLQQQQTIPHQQQQRQYFQQLQEQNRLQLPQYWPQQPQMPHIQRHQQRKQPEQQQSQYLQQQQLEWQHLQHQQQQAQTEYNYDLGFADLRRGSQSYNCGCSIDSGIGSTIPSTACGGTESQDNTGYLPRSATCSGSREVTSVLSQDGYPIGGDMPEGVSDPGYASADLTNRLNCNSYHVSHGPSVSPGPPAVAREPPTISNVTAATRGRPDGSELPVESDRSEVSPGASGKKPSSDNENRDQGTA